MKRTAAVLLLAGMGVHGAAQELPRVTVTATRTEARAFDVPASVTSIDGDALRDAARPEVSLAESLALVPGLAARDRQNFAQDLQLSIRGFGARSTFGVRGVRVYVDGIPATMPDGQGQLSHIDLATAGRIEVLRGPFSVLYGNSSGGVMQVFTDPGEAPSRVGLTFIAGSNGLQHPGLRASGAAGSVKYVFSVNHLELQGWRDHSAVSRDLGNARLDWDTGEGRHWMVVANSVNLRAQDPLGLTQAQFLNSPRSADPSALQFDTRKTVRQDQTGLVHEVRLSEQDQLRALVYAGARGTEQFQAIPVAAQSSALHPGGVIGLARGYAGGDLRWTRKLTLLDDAHVEMVAGLSHDELREHRRGWQNFVGTTLGVEGALRRDEDNRVSSTDPYAQARWTRGPWALMAGVRRSTVRFASADHFVSGTNGDDSGSVRYAATLPAAAMMYALSDTLHVYAAYGRGFETPTLNELAYRPSGAPGLNFALRPSRSENMEVGLKGRQGRRESGWRHEWNLAAFETRTRDEIVTQTNVAGRSTFTNAGATQRRGVEIAWDARRGPWRVQLAHTWLDAIYRDGFSTCVATPCAAPNVAVPAGNRIPGIARSTSALELAWARESGWRAGAELRRSSRVFVNDANSQAAPAFTSIALSAGYLWNAGPWSWAASARVDNLLDRRWAGSLIVNEGNGRYYEPAPGRALTAKVTASYAF